MNYYTTWSARLLQINHVDEDVQRRGINTIVVGLGAAALSILTLAMSLVTVPGIVVIIICITFIAINAGVVLLARRGQVTIAALILICAPMVSLLGSTWFNSGASPLAPFYCLVSMLIASIVLRPWLICLAWLANLICAGIVFVISTARPYTPVSFAMAAIHGAILCSFAALMGVIGARGVDRALTAARIARQHADQTAVALSEANAVLEERVQERTEALQTALAEVEARARVQADLLTELERSREVIRELSVPVLPVNNGTLVMPLVGALDSARLHQIQEQALSQLAMTRARRLLLDITGVPVVDSQVAQGLLRVVEAAKLLGAEIALVGIRPEVAQAIVQLGLDLSKVHTYRDLQGALLF